MQIHLPFTIGSRLLPALRIGDAFLSLERDDYATAYQSPEGRDIFRWYVDLPDGTEHSAADLKSGCQGCTVQEAFCSLLSFLDAAQESLAYQERHGRGEVNDDSNASLFPRPVVEWAHQHADEIGSLRLEIEESGIEFIDE